MPFDNNSTSVKKNCLFRFTLYCTDGDFFKHYVTMTHVTRAHGLLENFIIKGVTIYDKKDNKWTRISPRHITKIDMEEVK